MENMPNRCFIIGGGPSINDIDLSKIKKEFVIGINAAYKLGDFIDIWFFADTKFYNNNKEATTKWKNRIVSLSPKTKNIKKIEYYPRYREGPLSPFPDKIGFPSKGANSGASAIDLAIKEGFKEIILLGYDMKVVNGRHNFHNDYKNNPVETIYNKFSKVFDDMLPLPDGITVLNANPNSNLHTFPKITL